MGFEVKGGREAGEKFINALEMVYHVANIGDSEVLLFTLGVLLIVNLMKKNC